MNAWALHGQLLELARGADPPISALAKRVADAYEYPVDSLVLAPDGEILAHIAAMEALMDEGAYARMLEATR